ncbi:pilus assembly protein PilP [Legionella sp.]|uniref:pilus assembly protein PilP n=1 Tax=Legionella sp. TaxID=459 RepID=UPI003CAB96BE
MRSITVSIFSLLLAACSGDNDDLMHYIAEVKQRKMRSIELIPTFASLSRFKFPNDDSRRNPFIVMNGEKQIDSYISHQNQIKQALEAYPLDTLKFVGTLAQDNRIWGLIKQPNSQIIPVHIGDCIGQNHGRIILIQNNLIKLQETIKDASGMWEKHTTTLDLYIRK